MSGTEPADPPPVLAHAYAEVMRLLLRQEPDEPEQSEAEALTVSSDPVTCR